MRKLHRAEAAARKAEGNSEGAPLKPLLSERMDEWDASRGTWLRIAQGTKGHLPHAIWAS